MFWDAFKIVNRINFCILSISFFQAYASRIDPLSFAPMSHENPFFPSHHAPHSDQSRTLPDGFSGLAPADASAAGFGLPLGDLLELEGCFDEM